MRSTSLFLVFCLLVSAQTRPLRPPEQPNPKTLIPQVTIESIVAEISGTLAMNSIYDLGGYEHNRLEEEYRTTYREAAYMEKMAKQYGLGDVHIERFPLPTKTWDGELGELWLLTPQKKLIVSYRDIAASLAPGSHSADVTGELVYVGRGDKDSDYVGKDVAGKIVLAGGAPGAVHNLAVRKYNAAGVASFANNTGRPIDRPDEIAWNNLGGRGGGAPGGDQPGTTFAFNLSHRMGMELVDLSERGEKLTVHAKVKATEYDADMQVPTAVIQGDGSSRQEIAFTGHLFEGIAKQGAMDDISGCAATLEMARAWKKLIDDGVLPRPRRTVRFAWVPEIQGTNAYLDRYPEETRRIIAAVSIDMAGEDVKLNKNSLYLMRTPYSVNSFINEVTQQFFEYVGDTNREKGHNRTVAYNYLFPILDPQGSRDPFYYNVDKHVGGSDHTAFLGHGVPAVLFNYWPDWAYHTSEDRPWSGDATQMKREIFIALATGHVIASADGPGAVRIAETTAGQAAQRNATELRHALQMIGDRAPYREARLLIEQAYLREAEAIRSAKILAEGDAKAIALIEEIAATFVDAGRPADMARLNAYAKATLGSIEVKLTADEETASRLIPKPKNRAAEQTQGFGGGGGRGGAGGNNPNALIPGVGAVEARLFADGKRSVLDIRDAVSAEFFPQDTAKFVEFFRALEKAGLFEITQRN
jgi:aminopeptidase YwaD